MMGQFQNLCSGPQEWDNMLRWKRKKWGPITHPKRSTEFRVKVALEAIKRQYTATEPAKEFGVHGDQINLWKKQLLEAIPKVFRQEQTYINPSAGMAGDRKLLR